MTPDNTKINYSSAWDIDQVLLPEPVPLSLNISAVTTPGSVPSTASITYAHNLGYLPVLEAQFKGAGMTTWHQCGLPDGFILANWDTSGFGGTPSFYPGMIQTNGAVVAYGFDENIVYFNALNYNTGAQTISIRLYIWGDKVNY